MNSRRLFSRTAQIVIWIILVVLAFFLIRGFARGNLYEKRAVYRLEKDKFCFIRERCEIISFFPFHTKSVSKDNHDSAADITERDVIYESFV